MPEQDHRSLISDPNETRAILSLLARMGKIRQPVKFHNLVKGVPVCFDAFVTTVRRDMVVQFAVHRYQAAALDLERHGVVTCESFVKPVWASLDSIDFRKRTAALSRFRFVESCAVHRGFYRVDVNGRLPLVMLAPGRKLWGRVKDISISGLGARLEKDHGVEPGRPVLVGMRLPNGVTREDLFLKMRGQVVRVTTMEAADLVGLHLLPGTTDRDRLARFIFRSQAQIMRHFKELVNQVDARFRDDVKIL